MMHPMCKHLWANADSDAQTSSGKCGQGRPRTACISMQSGQGLHCLLTKSLDTTECKESKDPDESLYKCRMI